MPIHCESDYKTVEQRVKRMYGVERFIKFI